ncbi:MAG: helix-turn-helix domain-containing protein [Phycisphaerae bacterium]|nr:helix-turn-helix domain-containing protein [Phycisphaerae bacterium]
MRRRQPRHDELSYSHVVLANGDTYVLVPEDEYVELIKAEMALEAVAKLEDPNTKWIDFDDYKLQLAGSKIAEARKAKGLTQAQLSKKLGLPQSQISRLERNPDRTTVRTLKRIAKALGVDVKILVE